MVGLIVSVNAIKSKSISKNEDRISTSNYQSLIKEECACTPLKSGNPLSFIKVVAFFNFELTHTCVIILAANDHLHNLGLKTRSTGSYR